jgi:hypothetical protein
MAKTKINQSPLNLALNLYPKGARRVYKEVEMDPSAVLTREDAQDILSRNFDGQRGVSKTAVKEIASKMNAGEWMNTGQPILIDWYDRLIDGQHRLTAFLDSDLEEIEMTIIRGVDPKSFRHIDDGGRPRTLGDLLHSGQMPRSGMASSAFRMMTAFDALERRKDDRLGYIAFGHRSAKRWKFRDMATTWILDHRELIDQITATLASQDAKAILRPLGVFLGFYLWVRLDHQAKADKFFELLISGEGLSKSDPATAAIYQLRRTLAHLNSANTGGHRTPDYMFAAVTIKAWNAWMTGEVPKKLTFDGSSQESWPQRKGAKAVFVD